jgi:hypothetical protein
MDPGIVSLQGHWPQRNLRHLVVSLELVETEAAKSVKVKREKDWRRP